MIQGGPDLSVTVDGVPSANDASVNYTITVTNHGPGSAPGATVAYDIPSGTTVDIIGGDGWVCTQQNAQIICTRTTPLAEGEVSPVKLVVHDTANQSSIPVRVVVQGTDANGGPLSDPNPGDNEVITSTAIGQFKIAGGGFGCTFLPGAEKAGATEVLVAGMFMFAVLTMSTPPPPRSRLVRPSPVPTGLPSRPHSFLIGSSQVPLRRGFFPDAIPS